MSGKSRQQRINEQDLDDGDLDDTIYYIKKATADHYHEDPSCKLIPQESEPLDETRKYAQNRWMAPCPACVLGRVSS